MSISSDVLKQPFNQLNSNVEQTTARDFKDAIQKESQVVNQSADINNSTLEQESSDANFAGRSDDQNKELDSPKAEEVNQKMRQLNVSISFELAEDGGDNVVKVLDRETGELVRQIPSEEFLKISKRIDEIFEEVSDLKGSLINSEA